MTPQRLIEECQRSGVMIHLDGGTLKLRGAPDAVQLAANKLLPHKPELIHYLRGATNEPKPEVPSMEMLVSDVRRQKVLSKLKDDPNLRYVVIADNPNTDPVIITVGIQYVATFELKIPRAYYDPFTLLELIQQHAENEHANS